MHVKQFNLWRDHYASFSVCLHPKHPLPFPAPFQVTAHQLWSKASRFCPLVHLHVKHFFEVATHVAMSPGNSGIKVHTMEALRVHRKEHSASCCTQESAVWVGKRRALKATGVNSRLSLIKFWMWVKLYWHRQLGTALSWFVWDFAFYGNKLFQSTFIGIIVPHASLKTSLEWTLLNSTVALVGYYFAAFTVDRAWMGRRRMQASQPWGFLCT